MREPFYADQAVTLYQGDALATLRELPDDLAQTVVTSPPYWGLRDYGVDGQIGLEDSLETWVERLLEVFAEVRRVLRPDGTLWLNVGDAYGSGYAGGRKTSESAGKHGYWTNPAIALRNGGPAKQLLGMPWRLAFALQAAGWFVRQEIIWHKPNAMPESIRDRPSRAHETLFLLSRSRRYRYDGDAIREPLTGGTHDRNGRDHPAGWRTGERVARWKTPDGWDTSTGEGGHGVIHRGGREKGKPYASGNRERRVKAAGEDGRPVRPEMMHVGSSVPWEDDGRGRNKRSVWTINTQAYRMAHFATFPERLVEPCVLAGAGPGEIVLDPFAGAGTTLAVAKRLGRRAVGVELNPDYCALVPPRIAQGVLL